jgi:hypothetical protein
MIQPRVAAGGGRKIADGTGDSLPVTLFDENIIGIGSRRVGIE